MFDYYTKKERKKKHLLKTTNTTSTKPDVLIFELYGMLYLYHTQNILNMQDAYQRQIIIIVISEMKESKLKIIKHYVFYTNANLILMCTTGLD